MKRIFKFLLTHKFIILTFIFAVLAVKGLLYPGLPPTHDGEYHVVRFYEFDKVLRSGVFYPRWAPDLNNNLGVPLFNYVYPLPNYFASLMHLFGFSFIDAFKLNMFFASLIGALFFFLLSRRFWGDLGGLVGSVIYTYSPYHFVDIYIRGSVGEVWALALFPAFLWALSGFVKDRKESYVFLSSILLALLVFSHNILALMFFTFSLFFVIVLLIKEDEKVFLISRIFLIYISGLLLSSIFWVPALLEKKYVMGLEIFDVNANFVEIFQLIFPSWGSGFSGNQLENQMSFQLGVVNILVVFVSLYYLFKSKKEFLLRLFLVISFFIVCFLMLRSSSFIWNNFPLINYFQFPWRFLSLSIFISSFLAAGVFVFVKRQKTFALILIFLSIVLTYSYSIPPYYMQRTDNYYTSRPNFINGTNSPGDTFNTIWYKKGSEKEEIKITKLNILYFPGWKVYLDGKETRIWPSTIGRISFETPHGRYSIKTLLKDTPVRRISTIISLVTFLILLIWFLKVSYVKLKK